MIKLFGSDTFYNDNDSYVAEWLGNLCAAGHLPQGTVDARSILEIDPAELGPFRQCHFFAGIGGWPYALALAEWPEDREVWTASLPCQPFSSAGRRMGAVDPRHLWPAFFRLVQHCRPAVIFGEQVASADVIGIADQQDENVQEMLDRESVLGILRELQGTETPCLQGLRTSGRAQEEAGRSGIDKYPPSKMEEGSSRCGVGQRRQTSSQDARFAVRPQPPGHPAEDRQRGVRVDGNRVQSRRAEILERAVFGSAGAGAGIYPGKRQSGAVCPERNGERLGGKSHSRDCRCDNCEAGREIERLVSGNRGTAKAGITWLAGIRRDLEGIGYTFGACVAPACGVGAPHIRQRLFWVAYASGEGRGERRELAGAQRDGIREMSRQGDRLGISGSGCATGGMADAEHAIGRPLSRSEQDVLNGHDTGRAQTHGQPGACREVRAMGDTEFTRLEGRAFDEMGRTEESSTRRDEGFWSDAEWLPCFDGKARRIEPGTFPLAHGVPARVGRLRAYGNAIVPQVAAEFVKAFLAGETESANG